MGPFKHRNRLEKETSPYLLQHAHNPVDWFPWGGEAFARAKAENKPVFLSVGYSACHWCHVMAHESFENEEIAALMNELFVNIKVDREERPDVDSVYMKSVVMLTGHGGWPLSVFLTPDLEPYWGGTYFPPKAKYNRPGFPEILQQVHDMYAGQTEQTRSRAAKILEKMHSSLQVGLPGNTPGTRLIDEAVDIQSEKYDETQGGFGTGMKFPEPMAYTLLLRHWLRTGSSQSMEMLDKSLTRMASGGMYDQLGGGFHRYSTDREWRVPHFEKMLYDNALMAKLYLDVYQATKQDLYKEIPAGIFSYIAREMTSPEGGFYSTQDADSEGKEGSFFLWSLKEVLDLLGPKHAKVFSKAFAITSAGDLDGKNVLRISGPIEKIAEEEGIAIFEADHIIKNGKQALFETREKREKPGRDEKIITGWNGLMITAFATGYAVLREESYLNAAVRGADFIWQRMWKEGRLFRIYKDGKRSIDGFLEDYAYFLESLIALYEASFDPVWIQRAVELADPMIDQFWDASGGGLFMTGSHHEKLVHRPKNPADEAIPSANAIAALALLKLGHLTGNSHYIKKGEETLSGFHPLIERRPPAYAGLLSAIDFQLKPPIEMVFSGPREDSRFEELVQVAQRDYRPNKVLMHSRGEETEKWLPLTQGKTALKGEPTVYLCQNQTCHPPVQSAKALENLLERPPMIEINIFDEDKKLEEMRTEQNQNFLNVMDNLFKQSGLGKKGP